MILTLVAAALIFWIGFDGGSYGIESRATLAIGVWWSILLAVVLGIWPLARPPRAALVTGGLLAALGILTAASITWSESAERAFIEFNRVAFYIGIFLVAVLAGTRGNVGRWADGLALGIGAIGALALASRLFPDALPAGDVPEFLPSAYTRLSWPVEYWNGLAILVALAFPFLLRAASGLGQIWWRALAVATLPLLTSVMYLTSSRGGFVTALVGTAAFLAMTPRRWVALGATVVGGIGSAAAIVVLLSRKELVNDPSAEAAVSQGRSAALLLVVSFIITGLAYAAWLRFLPGTVRMPTLAGRIVLGIVLAAMVAGIVVANPVDQFRTFKQPPQEAFAEQDFVKAHLLSGNGSGRWQFWETALDEFADEPLAGGGAGSYEAWWAQHGSIAMFVRDAHSLYLETLGELGVFGLLFLGGAFVVGVVAGARRLLASADEERVVTAALLAAFLAYAVSAAIDWVWELTIVSVIGIVLLGLLTGPATATAAQPRLAARERREQGPVSRFALGIAAVATGWLLICAQAVPYLAQVKITDSQAAADRQDARGALEAADSARKIAPWASSPYLQLALVHETTGNLPEAQRAIRQAIDRDAEDWRLWLVAARVDTKAGEIAAARNDLERAAQLNPRSPLFANVG